MTLGKRDIIASFQFVYPSIHFFRSQMQARLYRVVMRGLGFLV